MIRETCKSQNCIWVARDQFHGQLHFLFLPDTNLFSFVRPAMEIFINMKVFVIIWVVLLNFSRIFILPWPKSKFPVSCEERCALFTFYTYVCPVLSKKLRQSRSFFLSFLSFILLHSNSSDYMKTMNFTFLFTLPCNLLYLLTYKKFKKGTQ